MDVELVKTLVYILLAAVFAFGGAKKVLRAQNMGHDDDTAMMKNIRNRGLIQIFVAIALLVLILVEYWNRHS